MSSATRVPCSAPPSMPPSASGAEHRGDRAVVLLRRAPRSGRAAPPARRRRRRRASRAARRRSCPSRPRPAAAGASGASRASSVGDRRADLALAGGQLERQPRVEGLEQPAGARRPRGRRLPAPPRGAALGQRHLQDERLLEAQPAPAPSATSASRRAVDAAQRVGARRRAVPPGAHVGGQRVGHVGEDVEDDPAHALGDGPGRAALPRRGRSG